MKIQNTRWNMHIAIANFSAYISVGFVLTMHLANANFSASMSAVI